ncbi:DNA helicase PIF1, ATP-dependent [Tanacetum coccineum]
MSINSGNPAFSKSASKVATLSGSTQPKPLLYLDQLDVDVTGTIVVMIGRVWDVNAVIGRYLSTDFVVSDSMGNMIHCSAKSSVAHNFLRMKEGGIYSVKNFVVLPNKDEFRIFRHDRFMIEFDGGNFNSKVSADPHCFRRYPFWLIEFDQVEPAHNKYLIDIAGYVTNVGRISYTKIGSKTLEFYLANQRVTLWGELGDVLVEKKTRHAGVCAMVLTRMSGKEYNNKLYLSSTSSTVFYDDDDIPCLQELRADGSRAAPSKALLPINSTQPREWTLENLLIWARNRQNNVCLFLPAMATLHISFRPDLCIDFVFANDNLSLKGASRKNGKWVCEACNRTVNYPVFRLEVVVANDTTYTVVVMFNDTATELLKCSTESLMGKEDKGFDADDNLNLPLAIRNLIVTTHVLEIKSHTYYEYGTFESFNCWKINPDETAKDDASSSTPAVTTNDAELSKKIVTKPPTVCTPLKPNEERKQKGDELEDSDVDEAYNLQRKEHPVLMLLWTPKRKGRGSHIQLEDITLSFRGLLQNLVTIHANTIVRPDGRAQSIMNTCMIELRVKLALLDSTQLKSTDIAGLSTSKYASTRLPRRSPGGKVLTAPYPMITPPLNHLLSHDQPSTAKFREQVRVYNSMFCFTSFGAKIDHSINTGRAPYTFRINRQNYHRMGSLLPKEGMPPRFAQLYFFDTQNEIKNRTSAFIDKETSVGIDKHIIGNLISMLDRYSPVAHAFRMARDWCNTHSSPDFRLRLHSERKTTRQYNVPTVSEVVAIIINDFGEEHPTQDIDAMALCRAYGNPDLFITFTSNPKWPKISEMLAYIPGQKPHDRPDIGTRVFKIKLIELLHDLTQKYVSGESRSVVYVIEFQKYGLPHAHVLLWLEEHSKCKTPGEVDDIILAEMPSPTADPDGYKVVTGYMLHGPCDKDARNAACTSDGKCIDVTMFTDWFELNKRDPDARTLTYAEIPKHYVWHEQSKLWKKRKQRKCIGRIVYSSPALGERYYLRMLLNVVRGVFGFEELMTVNKRVCATFKEACFGYGLLHDDKEWSHAIAEASLWALGPQLRDIFVTMLIFYDVSRPLKLWEES